MPGRKLEKITIPIPRTDPLKVHCRGTMFSAARAVNVKVSKRGGSLEPLIGTTDIERVSPGEVIATFPLRQFRLEIKPHLQRRSRGHREGVRSLDAADATDDDVVTTKDDTTIYVDVDNVDVEKILTV